MDNENINKQEESEIEFNYIKSNNFRVIHADGAVGDGYAKRRFVFSFL